MAEGSEVEGLTADREVEGLVTSPDAGGSAASCAGAGVLEVDGTAGGAVAGGVAGGTAAEAAKDIKSTKSAATQGGGEGSCSATKGGRAKGNTAPVVQFTVRRDAADAEVTAAVVCAGIMEKEREAGGGVTLAGRNARQQALTMSVTSTSAQALWLMTRELMEQSVWLWRPLTAEMAPPSPVMWGGDLEPGTAAPAGHEGVAPRLVGGRRRGQPAGPSGLWGSAKLSPCSLTNGGSHHRRLERDQLSQCLSSCSSQGRGEPIPWLWRR